MEITATTETITSTELSAKVLEALQQEKEPLDTLQISKKVFGKPGTQKMINPVLYQLLKEGKIEKVIIPNVARPSWRTASPETS